MHTASLQGLAAAEEGGSCEYSDTSANEGNSFRNHIR